MALVARRSGRGCLKQSHPLPAGQPREATERGHHPRALPRRAEDQRCQKQTECAEFSSTPAENWECLR
ncbi:hypothetical protein HHUSO_G9075 [Huso huso]|uniref:Uncharacterized protein n=1 Tax=Huso huso TaxID=61971 RepID=A0ABR0ZSK3_HUSHU